MTNPTTGGHPDLKMVKGAAAGVMCEFNRLKALRANKSAQKSRCP